MAHNLSKRTYVVIFKLIVQMYHFLDMEVARERREDGNDYGDDVESSLKEGNKRKDDKDAT